jgi:nickel transport system ATP-binding protein
MQIKQPEDVIKKYPHQLSGGMLQRVMIGLALASEPKLIIADEPTTAIDSITQYEIIKEFIKIKEKKNIGLIFISHDLGVISKLADEVVVMHQSRAVQQGDIKEVLTKPRDAYTKTLIEKKYAVMRQFEEIIHPRKGEGI